MKNVAFMKSEITSNIQSAPTKKLRGRFIDNLGRVVFEADTLFDMLLDGKDLAGILCEDTEDTRKYNQFSQNGKLRIYSDDEQSKTIEDFDKTASSEWFTPSEYKSINIIEWLINRCETDEEQIRVAEELILYEERNLYPLLKHLIFLVDHFRKNDVVWGVGRGSSVSSYVLYLIGTHKVNSIKYGLNIKEFLR